MRKIITPPKSNTPPVTPIDNITSEDDNDVSTLLTKTIEILRREVRHLMMESSQAKLNKGSSTDLVNYIKLLNELHSKEKDLINTLTDEELKDILDKRNGINTEHESASEGTE